MPHAHGPAQRKLTPQQQQAADLIFQIEEIEGSLVDDQIEPKCYHDPEGPSALSTACIADTLSILAGIRDGYIINGQPRLASNIRTAFVDLKKSGHGATAWGLVHILKELSTQGLAAENCSLETGKFVDRV